MVISWARPASPSRHGTFGPGCSLEKPTTMTTEDMCPTEGTADTESDGDDAQEKAGFRLAPTWLGRCSRTGDAELQRSPHKRPFREPNTIAEAARS
jgi:hypothetical protein